MIIFLGILAFILVSWFSNAHQTSTKILTVAMILAMLGAMIALELVEMGRL